MANSTIIVEPPLSQAQLFLLTPIFVGCLLSYLLMGVSIVQLYIYYVSYQKDHWYIRVLVYATFLGDLLQSVTVAAHGYGTLCEQWGRPKSALLVYWWNPPVPIISATLANWCQLFYAWRIYQLSEWRFVTGAIIFFSFAQMGGAYAGSISTPYLQTISELHLPSMYARTIIWLGGGAIADLTIMFSMVYLLYSTRNSSFTLHRSELLINRLLRLSVETGCACAITACLELIMFQALPHTAMHYVFAFMLGKVYSNTLMVSLNNRRGPVPWLPTDAKPPPTDPSIFSIPQFRVTTEQTQADSTMPSALNASALEHENDAKNRVKSPVQHFEMDTV